MFFFTLYRPCMVFLFKTLSTYTTAPWFKNRIKNSKKDNNTNHPFHKYSPEIPETENLTLIKKIMY